GNPTILDAVKNLQSSVNALQSALTSLSSGLVTIKNELTDIQTDLSNLSTPDQSNVRVTPEVHVGADPDQPSCKVVNVSAATRKVFVQMMDVAGIDRSHFTFVMSPGDTNALFQAAPFIAGGHYCKFTVLDGLRTDIRGVITIFAAGANSDKLAVPAE